MEGDRAVLKYYIPIALAWGILVGEVVPGAGRIGMLVILSVVFWILFLRIRWQIVVMVAPVVGVLVEFVLMRPPELGGLRIVEYPLEALTFYVVVWPILLIVPFLITLLFDRIG